MNNRPFQVFEERFYSSMKISNLGKSNLKKKKNLECFKIGYVRENNLKIPQLRQLHCRKISAKALSE